MLERVKEEGESEKGRSKELKSNRTGKGDGREAKCIQLLLGFTANARYRRPAT